MLPKYFVNFLGNLWKNLGIEYRYAIVGVRLAEPHEGRTNFKKFIEIANGKLSTLLKRHEVFARIDQKYKNN